MRPIRPARPRNRDGVWYLIRKVPKPLREIDRRGIVRLSTGIAVATDPRAVHASRVVKQLDAHLETYWRNLRAGGSDEARRVFEEAFETAAA